MAVQFVIRVTFLLLLTYGSAEAAAAPMARSNCHDRCGNISIPYPFGIGDSCYMEKWFEVVCNRTADSPAKAFLASIDVELLEIKIGDLIGIDSYSPQEPGIVRVNMPNISSNCRGQFSGGVNMRGSPFYFSSYRNIFISTGCDNIAVMTGIDPMVLVGCRSDCNSKNMTGNNNCSGINCCQTTVPYGIQVLDVKFKGIDENSNARDKCNYAFLAQQIWFANITDPSNEVQKWDKVPVVLEWTAPNNFTAAMGPQELHRRNADSYYTNYGAPYYYCRDGYGGNPYLKTGCQGKLQLPTALIFPMHSFYRFICFIKMLKYFKIIFNLHFILKMLKKKFLVLKPIKCKYSYTDHHRPLKNPDQEEKKQPPQQPTTPYSKKATQKSDR